MRMLDVLVGTAIALTLVATALPMIGSARGRLRGQLAARSLLAEFRVARALAIRRGAVVGVRFEVTAAGVALSSYVDGNGNGVGAADISGGIDRMLGPRRRVEQDFPGVRVAIAQRLPEIDGNGTLEPGSDAARVGPSDILSFTPEGTSSGGTVYLAGPSGTAYAVRVLGATARTRWLSFNPARAAWDEQ